MADPTVAEHRRFCSTVRRAGRAQPRRAARAHRGVLPGVRGAVLVPRLARARRRSSPASTRSSAASPTAGWAGSTWPATTSCPSAGSSSRGCSTAATSTPWPPPSPSAGSSPRSSTRTSSRSTTSSSTTATATSSWSTSTASASSSMLEERRRRQRRPARSAAGRAGDRLLPRDPARPRPPPRPRAGVLRLQAGQRHPVARRGQADRPRRRVPDGRPRPARCTARSATRRRRSPRTGPTVASDLFTVGRTLAVLATDFAGYQSTYRYTLPPARAVPLYARFAVAATPSSSGRPRPIPTSASRAPRRWAPSCSACSARSSPPAGPRRPAARARASRRRRAARSTEPRLAGAADAARRPGRPGGRRHRRRCPTPTR